MNAVIAPAHAGPGDRRPTQTQADAMTSARVAPPAREVSASSDPISNAAHDTTAISIVWRIMITTAAPASATDHAAPRREGASERLRRLRRTDRPK